jgi:hypothetical protein
MNNATAVGNASVPVKVMGQRACVTPGTGSSVTTDTAECATVILQICKC